MGRAEGAALLLLDVALDHAERALTQAYPHLAGVDATPDGGRDTNDVRTAEDLAHLILALRDTIGTHHDACCSPIRPERP